jgi:hypothetical protein
MVGKYSTCIITVVVRAVPTSVESYGHLTWGVGSRIGDSPEADFYLTVLIQEALNLLS